MTRRLRGTRVAYSVAVDWSAAVIALDAFDGSVALDARHKSVSI